jgi:hypothetical protein
VTGRRHLVAAMAVVTALAGVALVEPPQTAGAVSSGAATVTKTVSRVNLVAGADQTVDTRKVTATVSQTTNLRDRQAIQVTWSGAHPTGGLVGDVNSGGAAEEEYPFVILECRGRDSSSLPLSQQVRPETCWTATPSERFQTSPFIFPPYRVDRYAAPTDRTLSPGQPTPIPTACQDFIVGGATHWVPFASASGKAYPGGPGGGCAGIAPEAVFIEGSVPSNTTYGQTDGAGNGAADFIVQSADTNASLGCSETVACSLVMVPVMGISCDTAGAGLTPVDQPGTYGASITALAEVGCVKTGHFAPGEFNGGSTNQEDLAVSGLLWWSASNWRNRLSVPLSFAPSPNACSILNTSAPLYVYGSESMIQASLQWAPHFCLNSRLFKFQHVQTSEPQAKNLVDTGSVGAAFQAGPPSTPFSRPVVQAPVAFTGFAIATDIDDSDSHPVTNIKLTPRLLAKLLSESYPSNSSVRSDFLALKSSNPARALAENPFSMARDPEFQALNPTVRHDPAFSEAASTLLVMSSDSDVMLALTTYITTDPDARAFLDGSPDPWGMVVNPAYKGIKLPVDNWPQLDRTVAESQITAGNSCLQASPVPWLPLVASPVLAMATITLDMQYSVAASQIRCVNAGLPNQKLQTLGRQSPGLRFSLGLVSLGDAARYDLTTAQLLTHVSSTAPDDFDSASGRTFVGPSDASLKAATRFLVTDSTTNSWRFDYDAMRTADAGAKAYPGALLMSLDVPTGGIARVDAARYAAFLRFAVGPGQSSGLRIGQLPPGFLPLTAANGLATQAAYSQRAATAVAQGTGAMPLVSGGTTPGTTTPAEGGSAPPASAPSVSTPPPGATGGSTPGATASGSPSNVAGGPVAAVGTTQGASSGAAGLLLPLILLLALVGALIVPLTGAYGRLRSH